MLLVLDSNEHIYSFGFFKKRSSGKLLDVIVDSFPNHILRLPRVISNEVRRNLSIEEYNDFINFIKASLTASL